MYVHVHAWLYMCAYCILQEVLDEMRQFRDALKRYFNSKKQSCVSFERNFKSQHLQLQVSVHVRVSSRILMAHTEWYWGCEGWLSPGGHSSGGRALTAKVRGPQLNPRWLPVFHSSLIISPSLSSCTTCMVLLHVYSTCTTALQWPLIGIRHLLHPPIIIIPSECVVL